MLHWRPKPRSCDGLDLAAIWPCAAAAGAFPLSELNQLQLLEAGSERSGVVMEYSEAINELAAERALSLGLERLAKGRSDYRRIATEAVSHSYCACVTDGEDAAERQFSKIHRNLIDDLELKLRRFVGEECD